MAIGWSITDAYIRETAAFLNSSGLQAAGYVYVNVSIPLALSILLCEHFSLPLHPSLPSTRRAMMGGQPTVALMALSSLIQNAGQLAS